MSFYQIEIDDTKIEEQMGAILNDVLQRQMSRRGSATQDVLVAAVKELVYSKKDEIIEKVVDRASREIAKKGMARLMDKWAEVEP